MSKTKNEYIPKNANKFKIRLVYSDLREHETNV